MKGDIFLKNYVRNGLIVFLVLILCNCTPTSTPPFLSNGSSERLEIIPSYSANTVSEACHNFDTFTTLLIPELLSTSPLSASFKYGELEALGLGGLSEKLDDIRLITLEDGIADAQEVLDYLDQTDISLLEKEQQTTYEMLAYHNQLIVASKPFLLYSPMLEPSSGIQSSLLLTLIQIELNNEIDIQNYLKRLEAIPVFFEQVMAYESARKEKGLLLPSSLYDLVSEQLDVLVCKPKDFMIYQDFCESIEIIQGLSLADKSVYKSTCLDIITDSILPSYEKLKLFIPSLQTENTFTGSIGEFPLGQDYYEHLIYKETSYAMSSTELLELVDQEITRLSSQLQELYFLKPELLIQDFGSSLPVYNSLQSLYELETRCLQQQFYDYNITPANDFVIPDYLSDYLAAGFYFPVSIDGASYGNMYLNSRDYYSPNASTLELLFHEDIPGHHLYFSQFYGSDAPTIRKLYSWLPYEEGWAQYIQGLAIDYYGLNKELTSFLKLVSRLSYLTMLRCDIQFHSLGADRSQILETYLEMGFSKSSASKAIDRMIAHPGEIIHYVFGAYKMEQYQLTCKEQLNSKFSIKDFHDLLLQNGGVPFKRMDVLVSNYIQEMLNTPSIPY